MLIAVVIAAAAIPPAELPASVYRARRERLMSELGGCAAVLASQGKPQGIVEELRKAGFPDKFIHSFGHFVGLEVHDAGDHEAPLPPGAVITVEPGVYLPEKGFGVRIEDMVEITAGGYRLMSKDFPASSKRSRPG